MNNIVIGARGSKLSMAQVDIFKQRILCHYKNLSDQDLKAKKIKTFGDIEQSVRLDTLGGKGLFAKEIESHILEGTVDLGLHSMKDMPANLNKDLEIVCWLPRADAHDVMLTNSGQKLKDLRPGSKVGTSSIRRRSQLLNLRNDLKITALRGNIDTRIQKMINGEYDAIILSKAGLLRLNFENLYIEELSYGNFLPAACQGAIGVEIKKSNRSIEAFLQPLNDERTKICCESERKILSTINANCNTPIGILAELNGQKIKIGIALFNHSGLKIYNREFEDLLDHAIQLAIRIGEDILLQVGQDLIDKLDIIDDFNYTP